MNIFAIIALVCVVSLITFLVIIYTSKEEVVVQKWPLTEKPPKLTELLQVVMEGENRFNVYFVGGTLCMDIMDKVYCLHLDGTAYWFDDPDTFVHYLTPAQTELVRCIYLDTKGRTDYYNRMIIESARTHNPKKIVDRKLVD